MNNQKRSCKKCNTNFEITDQDRAFYEKMSVSEPTLCPECRLQRRMVFRNERDYYKRSCDLCKKSIIAIYPEDFRAPVYCVKCWWSDGWDAKDYGRDYDPNRPFLEQFNELLYEVPMMSMQNDDGIGSVNCEYTYDFAFSKNCYLVICSWELEDCMYSFHLGQCKSVVDCFHVVESQFSYDLVNSIKCYGCTSCTQCVSCTNCILGFDLRGCSDCIMCVGLRNKQYCILNKQYTKEEYEKKKAQMQLENRSKFNEYKKQFDQFAFQFPRRSSYIYMSEKSTGNDLLNCKNAKNCFYFIGLEDCKYMVVGDRGKDSYDCTNNGKPNLCYEGVTPDNSYRAIGTIYCWKCNNIEYSNNCHSSDYITGCSGVRHSKYVILNKQYSKEEYMKLRETIVKSMKEDGSWGEFFPASMSPHAYNESPAQEWIPLTKERAIQQGFRWLDKEKKQYSITIEPQDIPQTIEEVDDLVLSETLGCLHKGSCDHQCTTAFRIIPEELIFYRKMNIPLPQLCHNCRHYERFSRRNEPKLWSRKCQCAGVTSENEKHQNTVEHFHGNEHCPNEFETSYSPDRKEIIYCEQCYNAEVV